jgi:hypothetical protein
MFDYPVSLPCGTLYDDLLIGPEATSQEVADAQAEQLRRIGQKSREVQERLNAVYAQVPGLQAALQTHDRLAENPDAGNDLIQARDEVARLERSALRLEPEYRRWRDRLAELQARRAAMNCVDLQNQQQRAEYDAGQPPCDLLKLERDPRNPFSVSEELDLDRQLTLAQLRRELVDFLEGHGEHVFHPSDFTRDDFSPDFKYHPLLDSANQ